MSGIHPAPTPASLSQAETQPLFFRQRAKPTSDAPSMAAPLLDQL